MVTSMMSVLVVDRVPRRTLLIWGHLGMGISHFMVAIFYDLNMNYGILAMILLFITTFQNSSGVVAWLYAAETVIDPALGLCLLSLWGTTFFLSLTTPLLLNKDVLGPKGVFYLFAGYSIAGMIYSAIFMKETYGKTDKYKKELYLPKKFKVEDHSDEDSN